MSIVHCCIWPLFQDADSSLTPPSAENATPTPDNQMDFRVKTLKELKAEKIALAAQGKARRFGGSVEGAGLKRGRELGGLDEVESEVKQTGLRVQRVMPKRLKVKLGVQGSGVTKSRLKKSQGVVSGPEELLLNRQEKALEEKKVVVKRSPEKKLQLRGMVKVVSGLEDKKSLLSDQVVERSEERKPEVKKLRLRETQVTVRESEQKKPEGKKLRLKEAQEMVRESEQKKQEGKKLRLREAQEIVKESEQEKADGKRLRETQERMRESEQKLEKKLGLREAQEMVKESEQKPEGNLEPQETVRGAENMRLKLGGAEDVLEVEIVSTKVVKVGAEVKSEELRDAEKKKVTLVRRKVVQDLGIHTIPTTSSGTDSKSVFASGMRPGTKRPPRMEEDPLSAIKRQRLDEENTKTIAGNTMMCEKINVRTSVGEHDDVSIEQDVAGAGAEAVVGVAKEDSQKERKMSIAELRKEM